MCWLQSQRTVNKKYILTNHEINFSTIFYGIFFVRLKEKSVCQHGIWYFAFFSLFQPLVFGRCLKWSRFGKVFFSLSISSHFNQNLIKLTFDNSILSRKFQFVQKIPFLFVIFGTIFFIFSIFGRFSANAIFGFSTECMYKCAVCLFRYNVSIRLTRFACIRMCVSVSIKRFHMYWAYKMPSAHRA